MTEYKKEAPKWINEDMSFKSQDDIEGYLGVALNEISFFPSSPSTEIIKNCLRKAWDLVPEESAIIELIKSCNFCGNKMPEIEYYLPCSRKRYCSTECLKNDQKKK